MGSRKEEERNEKIIRGLMKLPPNRRCINCNSLGPQYVCTNFWTFVCMTCSGIHREFTHRVKSVSMSKFTSQEVEALQNGGNQRAREIYLKDWDQQRQRLPSNVDKVREFIKHVFVDKRYAGGTTADKPPRDMQSHRNREDEMRRASSYHSYSQSPPYDFQYEDRRYGKQATTLTRKPGSDKGLYMGKLSSFVCSPTHLSEKSLEDRYADEGSVSRASDYSVSSGGEPIRSGTGSPNFQKDIRFSSPPVQPSREITGEDEQLTTMKLFSEANLKRDADRISRPQRTASLGSVGSFDSNSLSLKSYNSGSFMDVFSEPEKPSGAHQDAVSTLPQSSASINYGSLDLFKAPVAPESNTIVASPVDLFQFPATSPSPSVDLFQGVPSNSTPSLNLFQGSQTSQAQSLDLFAGITEQKQVTTIDKNSPESYISKNEGWATFDTQPTTSTAETENLTSSEAPSHVGSAKFDPLLSLNASMQWPSFQTSGAPSTSFVSQLWPHNLHVQASANTITHTWNAFDDPTAHLTVGGIKQNSEPEVAVYNHSLNGDQFLGEMVSEDPSKDKMERVGTYGKLSNSSGALDFAMGPSYAPTGHPLVEDKQLQTDQRSTNPFDLPYDSELEPDNMFLNMSSLQAALPNGHLPSTFLGGVSQPWFSQDPTTTYMPAGPPGGLAYMAGQAASPQLTNVQPQGPVASVGGNPFA